MGLTLTHNQSEGSLVRIIGELANTARRGVFGRGEHIASRGPRSGKYTGAELREIRARRGVGRRKGYPVWHLGIPHGWAVYPALMASVWGFQPSQNMQQWVMKPRKAVR